MLPALWLTLTLIPGVASAPVKPAGPPASEASAAFPAARIDALVAEGKIEDAIAYGRTAVAARPDDVDLRFALAKALTIGARRMHKVVEPGGRPAELTGETTRLRLTAEDLSNAKLAVRIDAALFEEGMLHLSEGIRRAPVRKDLRLTKVYLLVDAARYDRAVEALREALRALPRSPALAKECAAFGAEAVKRGDAAEAARLLRVVADAFPAVADVHADLGMVLLRTGDGAKAVAALDAAAGMAPSDAAMQRRLANAAMMARDFPRARRAYLAAFRAGRKDTDRFGAAAAAWTADPGAARTEYEEMAVASASSSPGLVSLAGDWRAAASKGPTSADALALARRLVDGRQEILALPLLVPFLQRPDRKAEAVSLMRRAYEALGCPRLGDAL